MDKKLYKIGDLTRILGITSRTIRYYDQLGLLPFVKRSDGHVRLFDDNDVALIRRIRRMQKQKGVALEQIKKMLYQSNPDLLDHTAVVVDSLSLPFDDMELSDLPLFVIENRVSATQTSGFSDQLERNQFKAGDSVALAPSQDQFVAFYKNLKAQGYEKIYSVHMGQEFSHSYDNALSAAKALGTILNVSVIDSRTFGPALGLLAIQLAQNIAKKYSHEELDIMIEKQIGIAYQLVSGNSLRYVLDKGLLSQLKTPYCTEPLYRELFQFKPLCAVSEQSGLVVLDLIKHQEILECEIQRYISERIQACGGYLTRVVISHHNMLKLAHNIEKFIRELHSQTIVDVCVDEGAMGLFFGPSTFSVALI